MTQPTQRFNEIDLLRGVACAAVVAFHYLSRGPRAEWMSQALNPWLEPVARYGYLGVHLFFVISGFVILMSAQNASTREFFASRVARLYPALWVGASLTAGTAWALADPKFSVSLPHFLANLTMLPHWFKVPYVDGAYWSLAVEVHFYLYVAMALWLGQMHRMEWLLAAWLLVSALNALRPMWPVEFWLDAKWAPLFVAGGCFFLIRTRGLTFMRTALLACSYVLAVYYAVTAEPTDNPWIVSGVITAIYAIFMAIAFDRWRMAPSRLTLLAGALTYPVYVVHQNFGYMVYERLRPWTGNTAAALGVTVLLVLAAGWLIHRYVEMTAGPRLRRWISRGPRAASAP